MGSVGRCYQSKRSRRLLLHIGRKIAKKIAVRIGAMMAQLIPEDGVSWADDDGGGAGLVAASFTVNSPVSSWISTRSVSAS